MKSSPEIGFVTDDYVFFLDGIFSQWHSAPFTDEGILFHTAEHYMMYHKALTLGFPDDAEGMLEERNPRKVKAWARSLPTDNIEAWDFKKYQVVVEGNILKFSQHDNLRRTMLSLLPRHFVEASPYDAVWGIGMDISDPDLLDPEKWRGQNLLGRALDHAASRLTG